MGEVTHPGAHLLARCLLHPPGTRRAFSSSSEETSRVWRGPKTLGLRLPSAPAAREPLGVCCWPEPKVSRLSRRTPPCPTATLGPHALQSVSAVHIDRDLAPCLSRRRPTPKQNPRASDRILAGASDDDNSILGSSVPPQREIPGATAALRRTGLCFGRAFGSVLRRAASSKVQTWAASTGAGGSFLTSTPLAFFASV